MHVFVVLLAGYYPVDGRYRENTRFSGDPEYLRSYTSDF
ncbi:unnamed protein product, partial [Allacma fusca]